MSDDKQYVNLTQEQFDGWLADLRSGNFTQGTGHLKQRNLDSFTYCCLGVLGERCEILHTDEYGNWFALDDQGEELGDEYIPYHVIDEDDQAILAKFNDESRWNFEQIADYIEKNYTPKY